jgi:hypothetical protein
MSQRTTREWTSLLARATPEERIRIINAMSMSLGAQIEYRQRQPGTTAYLLFTPKSKRDATAR